GPQRRAHGAHPQGQPDSARRQHGADADDGDNGRHDARPGEADDAGADGGDGPGRKRRLDRPALVEGDQKRELTARTLTRGPCRRRTGRTTGKLGGDPWPVTTSTAARCPARTTAISRWPAVRSISSRRPRTTRSPRTSTRTRRSSARRSARE